MTHPDKFWKFFWAAVGAAFLLYVIAIGVLTYLYNPIRTAGAAAVGIEYNASKDPFASTTKTQSDRPSFTGDYFYQESLPLAFADWSWGANVDWNSTEQAYEGSHSFKVQFLQQWSGVRVDASDIDVSAYQGLSLAVYPDQNVGNLYISLYDTFGNTLGRQSIGWYTASSTLTAGAWNVATIPLQNLVPDGQAIRPITGFSISSDNPGTIYVDDVKLETTAAAHDRWVEPPPPTPVAAAPVVPIALPYTLALTPDSVGDWYKEFGRFDLTQNGVSAGPVPNTTNGSMAYLSGGKDWKDYRVDATLYWGPVDTFSLLVRFADDADFISCAFSRYGQFVQMYEVQNGKSTLLGTSPNLPIRAYEPWKDAKHGASVQGNVANCYQDGNKVLSETIPDISPTGTAGIETWSTNSLAPPHTLEALTVTPL
ncbi:MAG TPA: hypothetical protein VMH91_02715 [Candidatus Paceibacterota bacterium]|nr:hypothetical protein [Candidatus Paceibacterota bacterium]